jgi:nucleolar protein 56
MVKKLSVVESVMGILAIDENNNIVVQSLFPKKPEEIAERISKIEAGEIIEELEQVISTLRKRYKVFIFESDKLAEKIRDKHGLNVEVEKPSKAGEYLRSNLGELAVKVGFVTKPDEIYSIMREVTTAITRVKVKAAAAKRDQVIVQLISTVDELDKTLNLLAGRMIEWYGLHFPEMSRIVESHEMYARLIMELGLRDNFTLEALKKLGIPSDKAKRLSEAAKTSLGAPMAIEDLPTIQAFSKQYLELVKLRRSFTSHIENLMSHVAANINALAGSNLGARLIAISGGLERLARFPASTIQVLGAEKALFRSLKSGAKPPKHGIIFQHYLIHQSPKWQRGKIARAIAGKLAIAARVDFFTGSNISEELKADLEKRVREIQEKYKAPPERSPKQLPYGKRKKGGKF